MSSGWNIGALGLHYFDKLFANRQVRCSKAELRVRGRIVHPMGNGKSKPQPQRLDDAVACTGGNNDLAQPWFVNRYHQPTDA